MNVLMVWSGVAAGLGFWIMCFFLIVLFFGRIVNPNFGNETGFGYWRVFKIFLYPLVVFIVVAILNAVGSGS
jgi:hypothetical protein